MLQQAGEGSDRQEEMAGAPEGGPTTLVVAALSSA